MKRWLLLLRTRLAFSFGDIQELLNVQNSLGTRQQAPTVLSEGNDTSMEGLLRTGRLCSVTMFVVPLSYWSRSPQLSKAQALLSKQAR